MASSIQFLIHGSISTGQINSNREFTLHILMNASSSIRRIVKNRIKQGKEKKEKRKAYRQTIEQIFRHIITNVLVVLHILDFGHVVSLNSLHFYPASTMREQQQMDPLNHEEETYQCQKRAGSRMFGQWV